MSLKWSRRQFAATALGSIALPAFARPGVAPGSTAIRPASTSDIPRLVPLLLADAAARAERDPVLWALAPDPEARIGAGLRAELEPGSERRTLWLVAERGGKIVGATHAALLPQPGANAAPTGLLLDDCVMAIDAPSGAAEALLLATETALRAGGASVLAVSCPEGGGLEALYRRAGYKPTARYMAKAGLTARPAAAQVRQVTDADAPALIAFWMRTNLARPGQDMFVAGDAGLAGYVVARADAPMHVPAAHEFGPIGVIEDFCATDLARLRAPPDGAAAGLLSAAESALAARGCSTAIAACPAASTSTAELLGRSGYRLAKVRMLKA